MIPVLYPHLTWSDFKSLFTNFRDIGTVLEGEARKTFKCRYVSTFSSGRAALYNVLKANNLEGKYVLVSAYTCCVVTEAIVKVGCVPVFIDLDRDSFNASITEDHIKKYNDNLGAVIVTDLYGVKNSQDLDFLRVDRDFLVILDDALSPGLVSERPSGIYDYVLISGAVRKPFTCLGGGLILSDNEKRFKALNNFILKNRKPIKFSEGLLRLFLTLLFFIAFRPLVYSVTSFLRRRTPFLKSFFSEKYNDIYRQDPGYLQDMHDFQKRIGLNQLKKLDYLLARRKEIGNIYYELLSTRFSWVKRYWRRDTPYSHVPFLHKKRDDLELFLLGNSIDSERYFDYCIPELKQYDSKEEFPVSSGISRDVLNLPIHMGLERKNIARIVDKIIEFDKGVKYDV